MNSSAVFIAFIFSRVNKIFSRVKGSFSRLPLHSDACANLSEKYITDNNLGIINQ